MRVRIYEGYVGDRTHKLAIPESQFSVSYFLILSYLYSGQAKSQVWLEKGETRWWYALTLLIQQHFAKQTDAPEYFLTLREMKIGSIRVVDSMR